MEYFRIILSSSLFLILAPSSNQIIWRYIEKMSTAYCLPCSYPSPGSLIFCLNSPGLSQEPLDQPSCFDFYMVSQLTRVVGCAFRLRDLQALGDILVPPALLHPSQPLRHPGCLPTFYTLFTALPQAFLILCFLGRASHSR